MGEEESEIEEIFKKNMGEGEGEGVGGRINLKNEWKWEKD